MYVVPNYPDIEHIDDEFEAEKARREGNKILCFVYSDPREFDQFITQGRVMLTRNDPEDL